MRKGRVTDTFYQRKIYKKLEQKASGMPQHVWENCIHFREEEGMETVISEVTLAGENQSLCVYASARALNAVAAEGGCPFGVRVSVLVPETVEELYLETMINELSDSAKKQGFDVLDFYAGVQPGCGVPVVHVTGFGKKRVEKEKSGKESISHDEIIIVNPIALEGSLRILEERRRELEKRFIPVFLDHLLEEKERLFLMRMIEASEAFHPAYIKPVTDGGIFGALWELSTACQSGYEVDMRKFPIRQETVEICEFYRLNPYQMASGGCLIFVMKNGAEFVEWCTRQGIDAVIVGNMKEGKNKLIFNGEESRCTDRPAEDELFRIYQGGVNNEHEN